LLHEGGAASIYQTGIQHGGGIGGRRRDICLCVVQVTRDNLFALEFISTFTFSFLSVDQIA